MKRTKVQKKNHLLEGEALVLTGANHGFDLQTALTDGVLSGQKQARANVCRCVRVSAQCARTFFFPTGARSQEVRRELLQPFFPQRLLFV